MPQAKSRILLIDDDRNLRVIVSRCLEKQGYMMLEAADAKTGVSLAVEERPDLVLLDVVLPDGSGVEVCRELRRLEFTGPILMLTGQVDVQDRVDGLGSGADDYLGKPFDERELLARVAALLRRQKRIDEQPRQLTLGDIAIDFVRRSAARGGEVLHLTKTEFALLELLAAHADRPVSRRTVLNVVWGYARTPDTRTVDTHVWRLRKKLGDSDARARWIEHASGEGYILRLGPGVSVK